MNFGLMLAVDIKSLDAMGWVTVVIAALGLCLFFGDLIVNIKKRRNTRLNIVGLVFLSLSLVCFALTMLFSEIETIFTFIAIVFLIGYFVCDVVVAVCIGKQNKRERQKKIPAEQIRQENTVSPSSEPSSPTEGSPEASKHI